MAIQTVFRDHRLKKLRSILGGVGDREELSPVDTI